MNQKSGKVSKNNNQYVGIKCVELQNRAIKFLRYSCNFTETTKLLDCGF
jgi:hypothetical protein